MDFAETDRIYDDYIFYTLSLGYGIHTSEEYRQHFMDVKEMFELFEMMGNLQRTMFDRMFVHGRKGPSAIRAMTQLQQLIQKTKDLKVLARRSFDDLVEEEVFNH